MSEELTALFVGFLVGSVFSVCLTYGITSGCYQKEAKELGYASHDPMTGEWTWEKPSEYCSTPDK